MKRLIYNTANGYLKISSNGNIELGFNNKAFNFNISQFIRFVKYFNENASTVLSGSNKKGISSQILNDHCLNLLNDLDADQIEEFRRLINVPIYFPDDDVLEQIKNTRKQLLFFSNNNEIEINFDTIGLN